jgi:hypothetical protein
MKLLTAEEWNQLFTSTQREALHLEMRDWYAVDDEKERFSRFLASGHRDHEAEAEERRPWLEAVRRATQKGVSIRRARIVSEPVTDYTRFLYDGTDRTIEAGEDVRWLPRKRASAIALPGNDFWLFDETTVLINHFTGNGNSAGQEPSTDPALAKLCKAAFEAVWKVAIPHGEYKVN